MGMPGSYFPTIVTFWDWLSPDKIIHLLIFALFSFITLWGYRNKMQTKDKRFMKKMIVLTALFTMSYGGLTEILQKYLFTGRYGSLFDFIADIIGSLLGIAAFLLFYKKK